MPITISALRKRGRLLVACDDRAISAIVPPSPLLSARMISVTYLSETITVSVQNTSDSTPRMSACDSVACLVAKTSRNAYSGLVPMSP